MGHALTEVDTFTASVVVPDPADARVAASVVTPFQALANRTKHLLAMLNARLGVHAIANPAFHATDGGWILNASGNSLGTADGAVCFACIDDKLVSGCTISGASVSVITGAARSTVGNRMTLTLRKRALSSFLPWVVIATATDDGTLSQQSFALTAAEVVDTAANTYALFLKAGSDAGTNLDALYGGTVTLA